MTARLESLRQVVHISMGGFALTLGWLSWPQAAALALAAVVVNLALLPRLAPGLFRESDRELRGGSGIVIYPLAVLGLVLLFPHRLDIAAAAWAILAAGDGFATLVGSNVRSARLPWNRDKSVAGLAAFIVFGAAAGIALALWSQPASLPAPAWWIVIGPALAAVVAGFVETAPIKLNDNISVPLAAAIVLGATSAVNGAIWMSAVPLLVTRLGPAALVNGLVALAGWRAGTVTPAGAVTGSVIGAVIYVGAGPAAWVLLLLAFLAAALTTRAGYRRKSALGIAEGRGGRRGPSNAIANTGVAAAAAALVPGFASADLVTIACVAALVTGASDTVASEVGKAWGRTTWLVTSFRRVSPGTSGAVSTEGTLAGIVAALALGGAAAVMGLITPAGILVVAAAATLACLVEGVLGATLESSDILDNDALNFVNTAVGAGLAMLGWSVTS